MFTKFIIKKENLNSVFAVKRIAQVEKALFLPKIFL